MSELPDDLYVCNDCGEEFIDDGSLRCPHCTSGDLTEGDVWYAEQAEWEKET